MAGTLPLDASILPARAVGEAPSAPPAAIAHSASHGSEAMMQAVTGLHMNPLLALLLVVGLIFLTPWCLRRLKQRVPSLLGEGSGRGRALQIQQALPLGGKRTLFSVAVRGADGQQATAVILTGGPTDLCIGWLNGGEAPAMEPPANPGSRKADSQSARETL